MLISAGDGMTGGRMESDSLGSIEVPSDRYWGAQTQRALANFPIGNERMPSGLLRALGVVKLAAARVNASQGLLPANIAEAIEAASSEVVAGSLDEHFPLPVWQTGSGTQTNMNVNEVVAGRANEILGGARGGKDPVHPNDHVNRCQSSNDCIPTAIHVAAVAAVRDNTLPGLKRLEDALRRKGDEFQDIVKVGRTHCMDATPLTLGQEFGAYAWQVGRGTRRVEAAMAGLFELAQGGTAVGTGLNSFEGFDQRVVAEIASITGERFICTSDKFAALSSHEALVAVSAALRGVAISLCKIAGDVRLLGSGPRCGLGELQLPDNEPGSSIMPGKVNPTQCEALIQVCIEVIGNDAAIAFAGSQGQFELNTCKPLTAFNLLRSLRLIGDAASSFAQRCVDGLQPDRERIKELMDRNLMPVTVLAPHIGYDAAAKIAQAALRNGSNLRDEALRSGAVDEDTLDRLFSVEALTRPTPAPATATGP